MPTLEEKALERAAAIMASRFIAESVSRVASNGSGIIGDGNPSGPPSPSQYLPTQGAQVWLDDTLWDSNRLWLD